MKLIIYGLIGLIYNLYKFFGKMLERRTEVYQIEKGYQILHYWNDRLTHKVQAGFYYTRRILTHLKQSFPQYPISFKQVQLAQRKEELSRLIVDCLKCSGIEKNL